MKKQKEGVREYLSGEIKEYKMIKDALYSPWYQEPVWGREKKHQAWVNSFHFFYGNMHSKLFFFMLYVEITTKNK